MEIKNPRITVQNTTSDEWLVTCEGLVSAQEGLEHITFTVAVPRSQASLPDVARQATSRAIRLLQSYLEQQAAERG